MPLALHMQGLVRRHIQEPEHHTPGMALHMKAQERRNLLLRAGEVLGLGRLVYSHRIDIRFPLRSGPSSCDPP